MADNFIEMHGGILVRDTAKGFHPVETPDGFTDEDFRNAVASTYTHYRMTGELPDVTQLRRNYAKLTEKQYARLLLTDEYRKALSYRGIEFELRDALTLEQQTVLIKLSDFTDRRSLGVKLRELGTPMPRFQAWLKQPLFRRAYNEIGEQVLQEAVSPALTALAGKAAAGEDRAIEKLLEISGRWNPNAMAVEDARVVVTAMVEAIVKHVADPKIREAIMSEVSLAAGTMKALNQ